MTPPCPDKSLTIEYRNQIKLLSHSLRQIFITYCVVQFLQVSHHPPISAFHADCPDGFTFHGSIHPKLKFWGKSVEIQPKGTVTVELPGHGEAYSWNNVNCCVHNIIVGKLWIEQYGTMEVVSHEHGLKATLTFKSAGAGNKDLHRVEGYISDRRWGGDCKGCCKGERC